MLIKQEQKMLKKRFENMYSTNSYRVLEYNKYSRRKEIKRRVERLVISYYMHELSNFHDGPKLYIYQFHFFLFFRDILIVTQNIVHK